MYPTIPVFIASPGDVTKERASAEAAILTLAPRLARLFGVTLIPLMWEQFAPIASYDSSHPQTGILRRILPFSIFIGILANRHGTPVNEKGETGTEAEFQYAMKHRDRITILSYFRRQSPKKPRREETRAQRRKVNELKQKLLDAHLLAVTYESPADFGERILPDLMEAALELIVSQEPRRILNYLEFFRFGSHTRMGARPLLIVYPPMTDPGPGHRAPRLKWRERLLPHVVYEDSKAIQDVEEVMRLLGRDYKTVTTDAPDLAAAGEGDRVWICLPRNRPAQRVLRKLPKERVRFMFDSYKGPSGDSECCIRWTNAHGVVHVYSPLAKYLEQTNRPKNASAWQFLFGYVYARDYAILARFRIYRDTDSSEGEYSYHYFLGGIRGLGTWGIGSLVDHESYKLVRLAKAAMQAGPIDCDDVQLLLEITYESYRVTGVRDVSQENQSFFDERVSDEYIKKQVAECGITYK